MVLNSSLATALGRPDLAFQVQQNAVSQAGTPAGLNANLGGDVSGQFSGPVLALMAMVLGLGAFIYWVHPHLS